MRQEPVPSAIVIVAAASGAFAAHSFDSVDPTRHATPSLIAETRSLVPGQNAMLAVQFEIEPRWHLYWPGRNDSGLAPEIKLTGPEGYEFGEPLWPAPKRHVQAAGILDHVFEGRLTVLIPLSVPKGASGEAKFEADLSWLACERVCVAESAKVDLTLKIAADGEKPLDAAGRGLIIAARTAVPKPIEEAKPKVVAEVDGGSLIVEAPGATRIEFYPFEDCVEIPDLLGRGSAKAARLALPLGREGGEIRGVVSVTMPGAAGAPATTASYSVDLPAKAKDPEPPRPATNAGGTK
ncbi:MAG: protein-disulfide reductase DsbD domain-containing protein [Phycisphaerales bacterium]